MPQPPTPDAMRAGCAVRQPRQGVPAVGECAARHAGHPTRRGDLEPPSRGSRRGYSASSTGTGAARGACTRPRTTVWWRRTSRRRRRGPEADADGDTAGGVETKTFGPVQARFERMAAAERLHQAVRASPPQTPGIPSRGADARAPRRVQATSRVAPARRAAPALVVGGEAALSPRRAPLPTHAVGRIPRAQPRGRPRGPHALALAAPAQRADDLPPGGRSARGGQRETERLRRGRRIGWMTSTRETPSGDVPAVGGEIRGNRLARGDGPITDAEYLARVHARLPSAARAGQGVDRAPHEGSRSLQANGARDGGAGSANCSLHRRQGWRVGTS